MTANFDNHQNHCQSWRYFAGSNRRLEAPDHGHNPQRWLGRQSYWLAGPIPAQQQVLHRVSHMIQQWESRKAYPVESWECLGHHTEERTELGWRRRASYPAERQNRRTDR